MAEKEFSLSGISQIVFTASTVIFLLSWIVWFSTYWFEAKIAAYVIFIVFCILYTISTAKVAGRFNGSKVGMVGALFGLITGTIALLVFVGFRLLSLIPPGWRWTELYSALFALRWIMEIVCIGGTAFLIGPFFIVHREYVLRAQLWILSGAVFLLAGILYSCFYSYIHYLLAYAIFPEVIWPTLIEFLLAVSYGSILFASILGAVAFFVGKPVAKSLGKPVEDTEN